MRAEKFVERLAAAKIGETYNFYREGDGAEVRRRRLCDYLEDRATARVLLVGEAPGFRGARISGIPFTSERQLTGTGPAEATATIVQATLAELRLNALCWNVVPTHPGTERSNRPRPGSRSPPHSLFWRNSPAAAASWPSGASPSASRAPPTSGIRPTAARPDSGPGCYDFAPADARSPPFPRHEDVFSQAW